MASFDYRLNPLYLIKECSSCGALYTTNYCCFEGSLRDKIICDLNKTPDLSQRPPQNCSKCGNPVDGHYFQGCALLQKKFKEDLFTYCIENGILQDASEPSNDNTNVVNTLQEPFVFKKTPYSIVPQPPQEEISVELLKEKRNEIDYVKTFFRAQSLSKYGDEHLDTVPIMKSDEFIKSSVENLVPNPSESEGEHECDVPAYEDFTTFSNILFDSDYDFSSSDDRLFNDEDIPKKIYSNPLFDEIDSLFNEFAGELTLLKLILPRINETDCEHEEETRLIKRLFDSFMKEIDLSFTSDDPMPPSIEEDDYDFERDILILEELLNNDSLSLPENESFHFDIPSSSCPHANPPDGNLGILNVKVMGDIFEHKVPMPRLMLTLIPNQEKY
nr:hypothetical protein [Tanacetum cinerariifolium]